MIRAAAPFAGLAALGLASVFLPPYQDSGDEPALLVAVFLAVVVLLTISLRRDVRTWVDPAAPFVFFLVIALERDLTGGSDSGLGPLVALPILWLAMVGTRRDLMVSVALTAAVFMVPIIVVGAPEYPAVDWRRAFVWSAFAGLIGPTIQNLVRRLAVESQKERAVRAELDGIMRGARLSSMVTTDRDGLITSFGVGSTELLGYAADDMVGKRGPDVFTRANRSSRSPRSWASNPGSRRSGSSHDAGRQAGCRTMSALTEVGSSSTSRSPSCVIRPTC